MRLQKIKLAGFKTFPDPVTLGFPSNRVAIVGPNGCGKSNLIDAVRWVLGESSARSLRGEAGSDVIFNGSSARKPIGQAAVELIFDNSAGRVRGAYGQYAEIAIRRQLNRDGDSVYALNGVRCRRRDIHDLFLGTGLGPRSYAIIEQGLISKLIEARPEELRVYLEEAAGVAQYKERRRETETRLAQVREHLQRLADVRAELERQLQLLEKQAKQAERYRRLQHEMQRLRTELLALRWRIVASQQTATEAALREHGVALAAAHAEQTRLERQAAELHAALADARTAQEEAQQALFTQTSAKQAGQQQLHQAQTQAQRLRAEEARLTQNRLQIDTEQQQDQQRLARIDVETGSLQTQQTALAAQLADLNVQVQQADVQWQALQQRWNTQQQAAQQSQHALQLAQSKVQQQERLCRQMQERQQRLHAEAQRLAAIENVPDLATLQMQWQTAHEALAAQHALQRQLQTQVQAARVTLEGLNAEVQGLRGRCQQQQAEQTALRTLDEQADAGQAAVQRWRVRHGLAQAATLATHIRVDAAWETALERLLGPRLRALCVADLDAVALGGELPQGEVWLLEPALDATDVPPESLQAALRQDTYSAALALAQVRLAPDLATALAQRAQLPPGMSLLTPQGEWVGKHWLSVRQAATESGLLARQRRREALAATLAELMAVLAARESAQAAARQAAQAAEQQWEAQRRAEQTTQREEARLRAELAAAQSSQQARQQREAQLGQELAELENHGAAEQTVWVQAQAAVSAATQSITQLRQTEMRLREERDAAHRTQQPLQQQAQQQQAALARLHTRQVQLDTEREALLAGQNRMLRQLSQWAEQATRLGIEITEITQVLAQLQAALQVQLNAEQEAERALQAARVALQTLEAEQRATAQAQQAARLQTERLARAGEQLHYQQVEQTTKLEHLAAQFGELQADRAALLAGLPAKADEASWQARLAETQVKCERLGAVNLAAVEEYAAHTERKQYLDTQAQDLEAAVATLQAAILRIDQDTRARLRHTVETVDNNLQALFPRLFGGGQASLVLTGNDLLAAGVTVMARPPGKRNSTIHLLSGGEKTLTALALVFALFELNPAPFCLLDEVDAPLDEANVGRFGELLKFMATRVQFVFITHNKATMTLAEQLIGITMQEPGVSRAVAVDIDVALALTER